MTWIPHIAAFAAAVTFLASGFAKTKGLADFRLEIEAHRLLPARASSLTAYAVLGLELGLGASFGAGGVLPPGAGEGAACALLLAFSALTWRRGRSVRLREEAEKRPACACFGANHPLGRFPLRRNAALIALLAVGSCMRREELTMPARTAFAIAVLCAVLALESLKLANETRRGRSHVPA